MISLAALKASYLNYAGTEHDGKLQAYIDAATRTCEDICDQPLLERQITRSFDCHSLPVGNELPLYYTTPCTLVSVVGYEYHGAPAQALTDVVLAYSGTILVAYRDAGYDDFTTVTITVSVGYALANIPSQLAQVAAEMAVLSFRMTDYDQQRLGVAQSARNEGGVVATTQYKSMYDDWRRRLRAWRRYS